MKYSIEKCVCDRCRKEFDSSNFLLPFFDTDSGTVQITFKRFKFLILRSEWRNLDLCEDCRKSFSEWWKEKTNEN